MRFILLITMFFLFAASSRAQMDVLNRAFVFSRMNPAFVASPVDFNRASLLANGDGAILGSGQYYFRNHYMGLGAFGESDVWNHRHAGLSWAVHTIFLNAIDLQFGVQGELAQDGFGATSKALRYGVLFYYGKMNNAFLGFSLRQQFQSSSTDRYLYSFQSGGRLLRISRRSVIRAYATCDFNQYQLNDLTIQPMVFRMNLSAGVGYKRQSNNYSAVLFRAGFKWRKIHTSLVCATSRYAIKAFSNRQWELSFQYNLP